MLSPRFVLLLASLWAANSHPRDEFTKQQMINVAACMQKTNSHDRYILATKCEPLETSRKYSGVWLVGFELSMFNVDEHIKSQPKQTRFELIVPQAFESKIKKRDSVANASYWIVFIGRQSSLPSGPDHPTIVLDRLISIRKLQR